MNGMRYVSPSVSGYPIVRQTQLYIWKLKGGFLTPSPKCVGFVDQFGNVKALPTGHGLAAERLYAAILATKRLM